MDSWEPVNAVQRMQNFIEEHLQEPITLRRLASATGYIGDTKQQTAEVVQAIRYGTGLIPAVILLVGILLLAMVPINHKRELEIQAAIEARHGSKNAESFIS